MEKRKQKGNEEGKGVEKGGMGKVGKRIRQYIL